MPEPRRSQEPFSLWVEERERLVNLFFKPFLPGRRQPPLEVWEDGHWVWVLVEVPGLVRESVEVLFNRNELLIRGERRRPVGEAGRFHRMEIAFGPFEVQVSIPVPVDPEGGEASYRDGFLVIRIPKAHQPRLVKICVQRGGESS